MAARSKRPKTEKAPAGRPPTQKTRVWEQVKEIFWDGFGEGSRKGARAPEQEPLTARKIANRIEDLSPRQVSTALRSLEAEGLVRSRKVKGPRKLYFFALTGEYLTSDSHHRLSTLDAELRELVKGRKVGDPEMVRELEAYVDRMLDELPASADLERAEKNCAELIDAARTAELKKEIYAHLGFRPYYPSVNAWSAPK